MLVEVLFVPSFATLFLFFYDSYKKNEKKPIYLKFFLVLFIIQLLFYGIKVYADEDDNYFFQYNCELTDFSKIRISEEIFLLSDIEFLTDSQMKENKKKKLFHKKEADRCFKEANQLCKLIPNASDRDKALSLFDATVTASAGAALRGYPGLIGALLTNLGAWTINYYSEWQKMSTLLNEAKYHYEMAAFHQDILDNG